MTYQIGIYDHETGETIVRDMTSEEAEQREAEVNAAIQAKDDAEQAKLESITKKEATGAKLAALGLTTDDLKVLGLG